MPVIHSYNMPINTSSTGATYGRSSDPLCPLGFHPQVRWPTRCKRCFRDYKEHNDSNDKKKFSNLGSSMEEDPWAAKKSSFQKSKSVDVTLESGASSTINRFANYTTAASSASQNKTEEDIPEWKKNMLERRKVREETVNSNNNEESKSRNFGMIPGTTLHSSYVDKSYEQDSRLSSWGSASNLRASSSYTNLAEATEKEEPSLSSSYRSSYLSKSSKPAEKEKEPELSPYEKYLKRKQDQEKKDEVEKKAKEEDKKKEEERRAEREKKMEEGRKQREKEREDARKAKEEEDKKKAEAANPPPRKWGAAAKTTAEPAPAAAPAAAAPKWGAKTTTSTTSTTSSIGAPKDDVPVKKKPWEKPSAAAKSTLPSLNEAPSKTATNSTNNITSQPSWKNSLSRKSSDSASENVSSLSKTNSSTSECDHDDTVSKSKFEAISNELNAVKSRNEVLEKLHGESTAKKPLTLESAKAAETTAELIKARQKVSEIESELSSQTKEKKALNLKLKELESALERRPQISETQKTISELQTKLKYVERKCEDLSMENDDLRGNVQNLEVELEEVQDNFREDEVDEYRTLKRELENSAKNFRVLQFKYKKAEKSLQDTMQENQELTSKLRGMSGGATAVDNLSKIRTLEKEIESKNSLISDLKAAGKTNSLPRKGGPGPVMSRTGSVERSVEDQLLKDLQDSIERENDLKEQLSMAEDESGEMRLKISRLEDENESLAGQVKKMATKQNKRRSPSPYSSNRNAIEKDEGISEDGEELSTTELKVQLEVAEGETGLLRKKVENILTENLKLTKEVKDISAKLSDEKNKKSTSSYSSYSSRSPGTQDTKKVDDLQTEINSFRVKLIEKDREIERLDAQLKSSKGGRTLVRTGSQEEDLAKKLNVIEKEAVVLRKKTSELEQENETLKQENKKLHSGYGKKPASTQEKLSMDKFALEEKVKTLDNKLKEANKKIIELEESGKGSMKTSLEIDRMKREKISLDAEIAKLKENANNEKKRSEKVDKDLTMAQDKAEKAQREIIASEREKRKSEEEKSRLETQVSRLETDIRSLTREKDRYKDESENAREKNRANLSSTQEGMKAFKDQIDILKQEVSEEKKANKEIKRQMEEKARLNENEVSSLRRETERKASDLEDKVKKMRDLEEKVTDIEDKLAKSKRINQQRKDKIEKLEKEAEKTPGANSSFALSEAQDKIKQLEKQLEDAPAISSTSADVNKIKKEKLELEKVHKQLEQDYNVLKSKISDSKDDDYSTLQGELSTLRHTYNNKSDEWIKEKLDLEKQIKDLEQSIRSSAGSGWDSERNRFKSIMEDRDNQITNLKIECDVSRSQLSSTKKELDDSKQKLQDYEKMNRYGKSALESSSSVDASGEVEELKKQLTSEQKERRSDMNNMKMKNDSKIAIMSEEVHALKSQTSKYRRERDQYKEMFEGIQKKMTETKGKTSAGEAAGELNEARSKISDMSYHLHVLEDELSDQKMEAAKAHANMMAQKSNYEIEIAELNSKINEIEEENLIDSGRARIAGTRTKMELAWQKERESQRKLINEMNTMSRDLKSTLLDVEKEKERDRLDAKRKIEAMKKAFEEEQYDTKKQISDLQFDLLELRDHHAKLRTTNEKLRREKDRSVDDMRAQSKSRVEYGVEKQTMRLVRDMEEFLAAVPKYLGGDIMDKEDKPKLDNEKSIAKMEFKTALLRVKETKDELDAVQRRSRRGESIETINEESPRGRSGMRNASHSASSQKRALYRKAVSMSDGMAGGGDRDLSLWQSKESLGSSESVASNASIPLPVPVRTRSSGRGGTESGYSSDAYNHMTIRRLERDTSVDRLSTGSRESTQSELLPGEKKKSRGLLGKLKKIGRSMSQERTNEEQEFGSGSDISNVSNQSRLSNSSKLSTTSKMSTASKIIQRARSVSKDRGGEKKTPFGPPGNANAAFDKYFDKAEAADTTKSTPGATPDARQPPSVRASARPAAARSTVEPTAASGSTAAGGKHAPVAASRTYRRF